VPEPAGPRTEAAVRIAFCLVALVLLGTFAPVGPRLPEPSPTSLVRFEAVAQGQAGQAIGRLRFLAGWSMNSDDWRFGGISAIHVANNRVVAFSDAGWRILFPVPDGEGSKAADIRLLEGLGPDLDKAQRDVESIAVHGRHVWLGLERRNAVLRYERPQWRPDGGARPSEMRKWGENSGAEAMVRLADGRFLLFAEGRGGVGDALLFEGDAASPGTRATHLRHRPPPGYRITDAAALPDGRLLLLYRRISLFDGMRARLAIARLPELRPGAMIVGVEIATLASPLPVDNMEAVSVTSEKGRTIVWLASDDNYMPLQRSLLLKFALEG
jgi:hypothetical protein